MITMCEYLTNIKSHWNDGLSQSGQIDLINW
jgi:hypothetical protein